VIVGAGLVSLGAYIIERYSRYGNEVLTLGAALLPALILMALGLLACLMGIVGFVTVCRNQRCATGLFFSLLLVIFLGVVSGFVLIYFNSGRIRQDLHTAMLDGLDNYLMNEQVRAEVDLVQSEIHCCGVDNYTDWMNTAWYHNQSDHSLKYPESCCALNNCTYIEHDEQLYEKGCYAVMNKMLQRNFIIIASVSGGFACILLIGMLFSVVLLLTQRRGTLDVQYIGIPEPDGMTV